ncbi:MAG TPA: hypothetical protein PKY59_15435 [Pyrinomonadaceae bacterium]|nr:hypothetical protein [Pyrinomonadaceae bacterium]
MDHKFAKIEQNIPLVEEILEEWKLVIGKDFSGYKNHVYRMINFCLAEGEFTTDERRKIIIAGCFHDLGIWSEKTFDYIPPSVTLAKDYLQKNSLTDWFPQIGTMIEQHHKISKYEQEKDQLTECFRQGDLIDFSLGIFKCGLPRTFIKSVKKQFPNNGFHKCLVGISIRWAIKNPLNPIPVLRW